MKADIMSSKAEDKATVFGMRVKCCTLGPSKSYFIIFQRSYNGELLYSCDKLPKNLEKWLYQANVMQRDLSTLEVALGPGKSYFARDATSFSYDGIPKPMDALVEQMGVGNVKRVSLGKKGAFFFLGAGDTAHCNLRGYYSKSAMAGSDPKYSSRWKVSCKTFSSAKCPAQEHLSLMRSFHSTCHSVNSSRTISWSSIGTVEHQRRGYGG